MKKFFAVFLAVLLATSLFACGEAENMTTDPTQKPADNTVEVNVGNNLVDNSEISSASVKETKEPVATATPEPPKEVWVVTKDSEYNIADDSLFAETTYEYNDRGLPTKKVRKEYAYSNGDGYEQYITTYKYDKNYNLVYTETFEQLCYADGEVWHEYKPSEKVTYEYDDHNNLVYYAYDRSENDSIFGEKRENTYDNGKLVSYLSYSLKYPDRTPETVTFEYDSNNRITKEIHGDRTYDYEYDNKGRLLKGYYCEYQYDAAGRLIVEYDASQNIYDVYTYDENSFVIECEHQYNSVYTEYRENDANGNAIKVTYKSEDSPWKENYYNTYEYAKYVY